MSARVTWTGLDELREQLRALPRVLADAAGSSVTSHADKAMADIAAGYADHQRSGRLARGLIMERGSPGPFGASAIVKNKARIAYIFENGSQARHTKIGANRGSMPAGNVFVPPIVRERRKMYDDLRALLASNGLAVSGEA